MASPQLPHLCLYTMRSDTHHLSSLLCSGAYNSTWHEEEAQTPKTRDGMTGLMDLDIKDAIALESIQRSLQYHRQSVLDPLLQETPVFGRRSTLLRDLVLGRSTEISYERKLKSLMEKGAEPKVELVRMLKPEEVLSCRYLRLSKNNIRTLLKLCKDAGMNVDIHPHMVEGEIDAKKVFNQNPSVAL
ncbi:uncharacterized protein C16orf78 homolog [Mustela nigripes]|uniref:uncharacterized protein C16orf78 homolog n=1 Tax=Mustela nigripes TaxID=77151 RepID=UPI002816123D|nr:uncharacterized protein C16orf78 homolog [Mustela nigripes]